jgi:catechol 2,3-dioxygenase-like lactoylglutathione lyase family enzyme
MLDHVSLGVADIARAKAFYDAALAPLGYSCLSQDASSLGYGRDRVGLWLLLVPRPVAPDPKSGLHVCFAAPSPAGVTDFHASALRAGGTSNGAPGPRTDYGENYFAAYAVDPDGYRLEAFCEKDAGRAR